MSAVAIEPDWLVPVDSPEIPRGALVIDSGKIEFVGPALPQRYASLPRFRLPGIAILPGLVNAHCHLEFSDLSRPIRATGSFTQWLSEVIAVRQSQRDASEGERLESRRKAIHAGIRESWLAGVRFVVDMVTAPWSQRWVDEANLACLETLSPFARKTFVPNVALTVLPCVELIDVNRNRSDQTELLATQLLMESVGPAIEKPGLAPHAPYTASMALLQRSAMRAHTEERLMCMHLAGTQEELDWLRDRTGPFANMLEPIIDEVFRSRIGTINSHIQALSHAWRALVVHGNYLSKQELISLSRHRNHMGVVYCPRTHSHFQHQDHPAANWNDAIPIMLGTDSRASNPDLSIWEEICWASNLMLSLIPKQIALMATTGPARFLQVESQAGALRAGSFARLSAIDLSTSRLYPSPEIQSSGIGTNAITAAPNTSATNTTAMLSDSAIRSISSTELWESMLDDGAIKPLESLSCFQLP